VQASKNQVRTLAPDPADDRGVREHLDFSFAGRLNLRCGRHDRVLDQQLCGLPGAGSASMSPRSTSGMSQYQQWPALARSAVLLALPQKHTDSQVMIRKKVCGITVEMLCLR
jgi:hypothetical protein